MALAAIPVFLLLLVCNLLQLSNSRCVELNDVNCEQSFEGPDCGCIFNHNQTGFCGTVDESLGLNCSHPDQPVGYIVNRGVENINTSDSVCVVERVCRCMSRQSSHEMMLEIEETCRQYCQRYPDDNQISASGAAIVSENSDVCDTVHSQYCRRHGESGRLQMCAAHCTQEEFCESLIEGILEGGFESNDIDATLLILTEIQENVTFAIPVERLLPFYGKIYDAIERDEQTVLSYFNETNSEVLISLFDDLLSDGRQAEWIALQQSDDSPGRTALENLEITSFLLGMSHMLRAQLQPFLYKGSNMEMNVECLDQSLTTYTQVLQGAMLQIQDKDASSTSNCSRVISMALFSNLGPYLLSTAFENTTQVNTDVMTVQAVNFASETEFTDIQFSLPAINNSANFYNATCVFWNATESSWSTEGVKLMSQNQTHYTCQSTHLTSFAVLVSINSQAIATTEAVALSIVTYIGVSMSIISLVMTLIFMVALRKTLNKGGLWYIHFNLFLALLLALIVFVSGMESATNIKWLCATVAALLHYLFLCVFCWMLAEGILLYVLVVRAFSTQFKKWYYFLPLGWGLPIPVVAVSVGLRYDYYGTSNYCWVSVDGGVIWSFIGPMLAVILVNSVILVLTIICVVRVKRKASVDASLSNNYTSLITGSIKNTIVLLPLLGVTWIIGVFAVSKNTTVFAWTFTILNSLQGTMIFILHILRNDRVRKWLLGKVGLSSVFEDTRSSKLHHSSLEMKGEDTLQKSDMKGLENHTFTVGHQSKTQ